MDYRINGFEFFLNVSGIEGFEFVINITIAACSVRDKWVQDVVVVGIVGVINVLHFIPSLFWHSKKVETQFEQSW